MKRYFDKIKLYTIMFFQFLSSFRCVKQARFYNGEESVREVVKHHRCFIRFGDGEFDIMEGKSIHFQEYDKDLSDRLKQLLKKYIEENGKGINLIGMPTSMLIPSGKYMLFSRKLLSNRSHVRYYFKKYLDRKLIYGDALLFRKGAEQIYNKIWQDSNINKVIFVHNDKKYSVKFQEKYRIPTIFVEVPSKNAFSKFNTILEDIVKQMDGINKGTAMVLISAGPCAKPLVYELSKIGVWSIDTGHCWDDPLKVREIDGERSMKKKYSQYYIKSSN